MESIKCTANGCSCICYSPVRSQLRICSSCQHGWVAHAMDKIGQRSSPQTTLSSIAAAAAGPPGPPPSSLHSGPSCVDPSQANCLFDVASLILFGAEAIPTRLKILLDRLFLHLQRDLILQVLGSFGWSYEEYCRGYRIQDSSGHVLDKWTMATSEEELVILDQFQRFTETKSIAEEWLSTNQRNGKIPPFSGHPSLEGHGASSPMMDVKQLLLNGSVSRASDVEASRRLFGTGAYLSSLLPRYPSLYSPFLTGPGLPGSVGHLSQASVLPYLLARSPLRSLPKPMDFRMEPVECVRSNSNPAISHGSPAKRNGKVAEVNVGREEAMRLVKMEATEDRNSFSSNETNFHLTDEDEPIDYSTKDDRIVPDLSKTHSSSSSVTTLRNPSEISGSPGDNQSSTVFHSDQDQKPQPRKTSSSSSGLQTAKKPYQPTPGYGGTLISPNGKKRVLCTACLKTFCDKGALKIHYSAVHLKELHMCTIDGCTMTFSSRRSRNRHSANPNPKLHFGQTGRRRLHNNTSLNSASPFKDGQETTLGSSSSSSSPPVSPRSTADVGRGGDRGSPSSVVGFDGEFQLCPRSSHLDRCCDGSTNHYQPMPGHDDDEEEDECGSHCPLADAEGRDESQGSNTEDEEKTKKKKEEKEEEGGTSQEPPRFFHGTSKRKSAIPTRCSIIPPTEDSASDFQANDLDSSERKRRRLINDHVAALSDDSEQIDGGRQQVAFEMISTGNGRAVDVVGSGVAGDEEQRRIDRSIEKRSAESHLRKSVEGESIVDLSSRPSLLSQSSEMSVEDSEVMMPNGKPFLSQPKRDSEDRDSACGCCDMDSGSKGIEGFQRHFQTGPEDPGSDFHAGGQRSVHVCKVQGCNASFPSKRSRDRHSANANLHRRLFYSDSIDHQIWRKEGGGGVAGETDPLPVNMAPIDERKKSLDTALNLTTNASDHQMDPDDIQCQPEDIDSKLKERVGEVSDADLKGTQVTSELSDAAGDFPDKDSTMTDQLDRNHSDDAFRGSATANPLCAKKNFSVRKNRNLLAINENLHNHLLVNSSPASAQLAV